MQRFKKLYSFLTLHERKYFNVLVVMVLVMAFLDMLGVASILPFIAVLGEPELLQTNTLLKTLFESSHHFGILTTKQFLFVLGISVFFLLVISLAFKALTTYALNRFAFLREYSIGKSLIEGYLHQPYSWFLTRHSADLGKNILSEVQMVVHGAIIPVMTLLAQSTVLLALFILLIVIDPMLAFTVFLVLGLSYVTIFFSMSSWLKRLGLVRTKANQERFKLVNEAFDASKLVKMSGLEDIYTQSFSEHAETYAKTQATAQVITQLPRFALEAISFGGMLLIILYLMNKDQSFVSLLPIIALYVFAGYRIMPALQQIYGAISQLRFSGPAIDNLYQDLNSLQSINTLIDNHNPLTFSKSIKFHKVTYSYPDTKQPSLKHIDLSISAFTKVGFVGATGSGKTTIVDVILGLLVPQNGNLTVDDKPITFSNLRQWQKIIGYVPQQIYLKDDSVAANIAFGVPSLEIDSKAVENASIIANLHEFVINDLPEGYATIIGERGVRLSGGQRQRIGIARALYHSPQVLILDEATSALDNITEQVVIDAIKNLNHKMTIIIIAHRLSTVKDCDMIFLLDNGKLKAQGRFDELKVKNEMFKEMTGKNL